MFRDKGFFISTIVVSDCLTWSDLNVSKRAVWGDFRVFIMLGHFHGHKDEAGSMKDKLALEIFDSM